MQASKIGPSYTLLNLIHVRAYSDLDLTFVNSDLSIHSIDSNAKCL